MFSVNPRVNLGRIIFTVLIQKSEKQGKVLRVCLENLLAEGPSGNQTFRLGCDPQESLIILETSVGKNFPDNLSNFPLFIQGESSFLPPQENRVLYMG